MKKDLNSGKKTPAAVGPATGGRLLAMDCGPKNHRPARSMDVRLVKQHLGMMLYNAGRARRRPVAVAPVKLPEDKGGDR
jgi:hypothetical protein